MRWQKGEARPQSGSMQKRKITECERVARIHLDRERRALAAQFDPDRVQHIPRPISLPTIPVISITDEALGLVPDSLAQASAEADIARRYRIGRETCDHVLDLLEGMHR